MKYLLLIAILLGSQAQAFENDNDDELVCGKTSVYGSQSQAISCVSRASIELDKAQLKLVKMQIRKLEVEIKMMEETGILPVPKKTK